VRNDKWLFAKRSAAWAYGREQRDRLLHEYRLRYGFPRPPAPARVIDELLTDFLQVRLRYRALPADRFAETRLDDGGVVVTVNDDIALIEGAKDALGIGNVAKWHETIHVLRDIDALRRPATSMLPGFEAEPEIVCLRRAGTGGRTAWTESAEREFFAEEAGRAAAVSLEALRRSQPFIDLLALAGRTTGPVRQAWPLLYDAATEIGVNISALAKQLQLEGLIVIERTGGRSEVAVQSQLLEGGTAWR
jgi:hypothetical protein